MKKIESAIIIGGGVSGLAAAYALKKFGLSVTLLEEKPYVGGAINTVIRDGFMAESGPNSLLLNEEGLVDLIKEIGLENDLIDANAEAKKRYLYRNGVPVAAPMSPLSFIKTPLFSGRAKWRLFKEPFIKKGSIEPEESLAQFIERRLGREVLDYAINPLISGIYAGDPNRLSARYAFPKIWNLEQVGGSLIKGGIKRVRMEKAERKASGEKKKKRFKSRMVSFREGLKSLPEALSRALGESVVTGAQIKTIESKDGWQITWGIENSDELQTKSAQQLILAVPAYRINKLPFTGKLTEAISPLGEIYHPPVTSLVLGFKSDQVAHPLDGFGMLIPELEKKRILGTLFSSSLFPGRAPDGHVTLTSFVGGARQPHETAQEPEKLRSMVLEQLEETLGVRGDPVFCEQFNWPGAIPQYNLGYGKYLDLIDQIEDENPGLSLCGNYRTGISVVQCLQAGLTLSKNLADRE